MKNNLIVEVRKTIEWNKSLMKMLNDNLKETQERYVKDGSSEVHQNVMDNLTEQIKRLSKDIIKLEKILQILEEE